MSYKCKNGRVINELDVFNQNNILDTYVVSDTHFFHDNIIRYCNRPWCNNPKYHEYDRPCPHCDINKMNDDMVENWNTNVSKDDVVIHLGDYAFLSRKRSVYKEHIKHLTSKLNGKIYLVKGNHDRRGKKWFEDVGITLVKPFITRYKTKTFLFIHKPIVIESKDIIPIFGHWHNKAPLVWSQDGKFYFNVSVENTNYRPIRLSSILRLYEDLQSD